MSGIGSESHLNLNGLGGLAGQGALDQLQGRQQPLSRPVEAELAVVPADARAPLVEIDHGETVLQAPAWGDTAEVRLLGGDTGFENTLANLDLSAAVDLAVDAIFARIETSA